MRRRRRNRRRLDMSLLADPRSAWRVDKVFAPRASNPMAARGLAYERKVRAELRRLAASYHWIVEHNPWFRYENSDGSIGTCAPDFVIHQGYEAKVTGMVRGVLYVEGKGDKVIVVETKLTYIPEALAKLRSLYCPIISLAFGTEVVPLIITKNLVPGAPPVSDRLGKALDSNPPVLQWLGNGPMIW